MTPEKQLYSDPLINEVRERRQALFAQYGYDLHAFCDAIRRLQAEHPDKVFDRRKIKRPITNKQG